jgi:enoyl-[acyl-carrier-protein] reductase (NADH)
MDDSRGLKEKVVVITGGCGEIPVGEFGTAEHSADAFVFLSSCESNYITGQVLVVDGGCSLSNPE